MFSIKNYLKHIGFFIVGVLYDDRMVPAKRVRNRVLRGVQDGLRRVWRFDHVVP